MTKTSDGQTAEFVSSTVYKSSPNLKRPRLSTDSENRLAEVERKSAACYAGMETMTAQLNQLAADIDSEPCGRAASESGEGPESWDEDDSLVHSVIELRSAAKP
jgi:hypothetical protein